ncbi:hypothetical protein SEPL_276 [Salmonella phage SE_PL]|uniref:hypothetical protein n=1 Tax=Salmonella enterica TaxID=28901 RepID=UPI000FDF7677|nr:hypothetical protein CPT_Munch_149 [Salmonella phage Munch]EAZ2022940.1 hypothetical protein [Salmonella enterica]ECV9084074.1 hypothetical protein [Salmonella enterica subsp. enterica serovar Infantis]MCP0435825.1 hypothetical protein [Salmonella enterica subsp. enterica serovar Mbandaka]QCW18829.1 hypothetical protein 7t3_0308 [Salmonella phage 7t3]QIG62889.1 hypothetical protein SEPL_276 [Salmonella phage SE_PL]WNV47257.1 hypothetical protein [Klebsiella phage fENko-Kae01]
MEKNKKEAQNTRRAQMDKNTALESFKKLRQQGILTRQQFRTITFDKGLQGSTKGSPLITTYEVVKQGKKKVLEVKTQQWTRI